MRTLFPPLHEDAGEGLEVGEGLHSDGRNGCDSSSALSEDLRANFDALRSIVQAEQCLGEQPDSNCDLVDNGNDGPKPNQASKKRKAPRNVENRNTSNSTYAFVTQRRELQKRKFDLAVATAISVEGEISRLANGIAELEALLRAQEDDAAAPGNAHMPDATFPFLPPVVPPDDEYDNRNKHSAHKVGESALALQDITDGPIAATNTQEKRP
eukprot:CAMPEP_0185725438 /NCGR_PEP_ID=MMETSP1171-20130828/1701_1 /TAXON_ID=374046 /ORGANISM="Helicotheca tamensis, Strain CCMP826" /LENGTH=211 /DNA_ID=CAMNT_0028393573 /DNA_START=885 /DNA_END=1520 /DNA_ORIENTATION=+